MREYTIDDLLVPDEDGNYVSLPSEVVYKNEKIKKRLCFASDYAILNGLKLGKLVSVDKHKTGPYWIKSEDNKDGKAKCVNSFGLIRSIDAKRKDIGICPVMRLDVKTVNEIHNLLPTIFEINEKDDAGELSHFIEFGGFPFIKVKFSDSLEEGYQKGECVKLGKFYHGYEKEDGTLARHLTYNTRGNSAFCRVVSKNIESDVQLYDGSTLPKGENSVWTTKSYLYYEIKNWDELPKNINPQGSGKAQYIIIQPNVILNSGIPYEKVLPYLNKEFLRDSITDYIHMINHKVMRNYEIFELLDQTKVYNIIDLYKAGDLQTNIERELSQKFLDRMKSLNPDDNHMQDKAKMYEKFYNAESDYMQQVLTKIDVLVHLSEDQLLPLLKQRKSLKDVSPRLILENANNEQLISLFRDERMVDEYKNLLMDYYNQHVVHFYGTENATVEKEKASIALSEMLKELDELLEIRNSDMYEESVKAL